MEGSVTTRGDDRPPIATTGPRRSFYMGTPSKKPVTLPGTSAVEKVEEKLEANKGDEDKSDAKMPSAESPLGSELVLQ